jgi:hypothetical protein
VKLKKYGQDVSGKEEVIEKGEVKVQRAEPDGRRAEGIKKGR